MFRRIRGGHAGWSAVQVGRDGTCGVTVLPPLRAGAKPRVVKAAWLPSVESVNSGLADLLPRISVEGCRCVQLLERSDYQILVVKEPPVVPEEFEQTLRWTVGEQIDFPADQADLAWLKIPNDASQPGRPPHVYAIVARRERVAQLAAEWSGRQPVLGALDIYETAQRNLASLIGVPGQGVALLAIGRQGVRMTVTLDGELYLDRYVEESLFESEGMDEFAHQRACERIVLQVQRSLDFVARSLPFIAIPHITLAPMPAVLDIAELLTSNVQLPVVTLNLADVLDISATPELADPVQQARYFHALGAALRSAVGSHGPLRQVNLLGSEFLSATVEMSHWAPVAAMTLALVIQGGFWLHGSKDLEAAQVREMEARQKLMAIRAERAAADTLAKQSRALGDEIEALKPELEAAQAILDRAATFGTQAGYAYVFELLSERHDAEVWLTEVEVGNAGKMLKVGGNALSKEALVRYAQRLNEGLQERGVQLTSLELHPLKTVQGDNNKTANAAVTFQLQE